jgi:hypothetical protein
MYNTFLRSRADGSQEVIPEIGRGTMGGEGHRELFKCANAGYYDLILTFGWGATNSQERDGHRQEHYPLAQDGSGGLGYPLIIDRVIASLMGTLCHRPRALESNPLHRAPVKLIHIICPRCLCGNPV